MHSMEPFQRPDRDGWWIRYRDRSRPAGRQWVKRYGGETKEAATIKLALIRSKLHAVELGLVDRRQLDAAEGGARPIAEVLKDFRGHLEGKRRSKAHVSRSLAYCEKIFAAARAKSLADLTTDDIETFLDDLLEAGRSISTRNEYLVAVASLYRWACRRHRATVNPTTPIVHLNADADPRRPSRALTPAEFEAILEAATNAPRGGATRALYYLLAGRAGLRWSEIRRLEWADLDLKEGWANLRAAATKSGRADTIPLGDRLVAELRKVRPPHAHGPVFSSNPTRLTWIHDLVLAGIVHPYCDLQTRRVVLEGYKTEHGQADRKSLRATFVTHLAAAGVEFSTAVVLARHTDPRLTRKHYLKAHLLNLHGALDKLDPQPAEATRKSRTA